MPRQPVLQNAENSPKPVAPAYFFALGVGAAVVIDAYFVDAHAGYAGYFGGYFRLEAEAIFLDFLALNDIAPEQLATRFHVGQVQVGHHI